MLAAERRKVILDILKREGRVVAPRLSGALGVSEDTIRRDLREMAAEGLLQRVHGGALPTSPALANYHTRQQNITPAKIAIARKAASLIQEDMVILMGGGTTTVEVARSLSPELHATVITHNLPAAVALADLEQVEVVLVGGHLYKHSMVTIGSEAVDTIRMLRADLCLLGVCSLHPEIGISTQDMEEAYFQRAMIASSAEVAALASPEKIGTAAPYISGSISDLNYIITDELLPDDQLAPYRAFHVDILRSTI